MVMMHTGLIFIRGGFTGPAILRNVHFSDLISHFGEVITEKYDALTVQVLQLTKEINASSFGNYVSYIFAGVAVVAIGYMSWKLWSFSSTIMFATKHDMERAVDTLSKKCDNAIQELASTERDLTEKLEDVDVKLDEQKEHSRLILNDVTDMRSNVNEIRSDILTIHERVSSWEGRLEEIESSQDATNAALVDLFQNPQFSQYLRAQLRKVETDEVKTVADEVETDEVETVADEVETDEVETVGAELSEDEDETDAAE